jgi:hypothetical protein
MNMSQNVNWGATLGLTRVQPDAMDNEESVRLGKVDANYEDSLHTRSDEQGR